MENVVIRNENLDTYVTVIDDDIKVANDTSLDKKPASCTLTSDDAAVYNVMPLSDEKLYEDIDIMRTIACKNKDVCKVTVCCKNVCTE